jgi:hypothetical protein
MNGRPARKILEERHLTFNCYEFSRAVTAGRPRSSRWVSAERCQCTQDPHKILDVGPLCTISFREMSEEEEKKELEKYGSAPDEIGVLREDQSAGVMVPSDFMDPLWAAAIATDGVLRSISLKVRRHDENNYWVITEVAFSEKSGEPIEVQYDKRARATIIPPHPVVRELRAQRKRPVWSGIAIIAAGVLIALLIAKLWH